MSRTRMTVEAQCESKRPRLDGDVVGRSRPDRQRPKTRLDASRPNAPLPRRPRRLYINDHDLYLGDDEGPALSEGAFVALTGMKRKRCTHTQTEFIEPPQKRARRKWTPSTPMYQRPRHFRLLPYVPDVCLLEIFAYLAPEDLLACTRVCKRFRGLLLTKDLAQSLWSMSLKCVTAAPPLPKDVSEPVWANLLFGDPICYCCGSRALPITLWSMRRRLCRSCAGQQLVGADMKAALPARSSLTALEIIDALPHVYGLASVPLCDKNQFSAFVKDQQRIIEQYRFSEDEYDSDDHLIGPCAEAQHELLRRRKAACTNSEEFDSLCQQWDLRRQRQYEDRQRELQETRRNAIVSRFTALGCEKEIELGYFTCHPDFRASTRPLTEEAWTIMRAKHEPLLASRKAARLESEARRRRDERLHHLEDACIRQWKLLPPPDVPYMPSHRHAAEFETVADALDERDADLDEVVRKAVPEIYATIAEKKAYLSSLLPKGTTEDALERASTAFSTSSAFSQSYFGPEVLAAVYSTSKYRAMPRVEFNVSAREMVLYLLKTACLEECTTRMEMDRLDLRFVCMRCRADRRLDAGTGHDVQGRFALSWRFAVEHLLHTTHSEKTPHMRLVDVDERAYITQHESVANGRVEYHAYGCKHCNAHVGKEMWMTWPQIHEHLLVDHSINAPRVEVDWTVHPRMRSLLAVNTVVLPMDA
ncbi:unnamed protein product [Peniophora sp. CBMAI 1063]|nr:unnamed protein product [Peniophora sp. CBMAI 1063]